MRSGEEAQSVLRVALSKESRQEVLHVPLLHRRAKVPQETVLPGGGKFSEDGCGQEAESRGPLLRFQNHRLKELKH